MHANLPQFGEDYHSESFSSTKWSDAVTYAGSNLGSPHLIAKTAIELALRSNSNRNGTENEQSARIEGNMKWLPTESSHSRVSQCQRAMKMSSRSSSLSVKLVFEAFARLLKTHMFADICSST
jgi:hypothetical protein